MGNILVGDNSRCLLLTPRSGSHAMASAWLSQREPDQYAAYLAASGPQHPAKFLGTQENDWSVPASATVAVIVRNPIERFRSMVAWHGLNVDEQLQRPLYGPLQLQGVSQFFKFETQYEECAQWLGLALPIQPEAATPEDQKPTLTPEQEQSVRATYAADLALWESLS